MKINKKHYIALLLSTTLGVYGFIGGYNALNKEGISLTVKGKESKVSTFKTTVKDLLIENNIEYDENDIITPSLDSKLEDNMDIKLIVVTEDTIIEKEEIPYEVKTVDDKTLLKGKTKVSQEGKVGEKELTYKATYHDGKLVEKILQEEHISKEATEKIVKKGTKEEIVVASRSQTSRNNNSKVQTASSGKYMKVVATAYAGDTITATGTKPKWGTIAVDPRVIPYGTKVYIPQFNMTFVAEDCGGAIKGNKIDIFMNSNSECRTWGRRTIDIYIQ